MLPKILFLKTQIQYVPSMKNGGKLRWKEKQAPQKSNDFFFFNIEQSNQWIWESSGAKTLVGEAPQYFIWNISYIIISM